MLELSKEELQQIQQLRDSYMSTMVQLGQIAIDKINLEKLENTVKQTYSELQDKETAILKDLNSKYGDVSIDLETGSITKNEN